MKSDYEMLKSILSDLRSDYISDCQLDKVDKNAPITERDIVAEIYCRLKVFYKSKGLSVHCEIKPAPNENAKPDQLRGMPKIDVVILSDTNGRPWISSAITLQNNYSKGSIESRFSSVPVEFFHTAIEVKIQSKSSDAKKDIDILKSLHGSNDHCNCFFVLLNTRGKRSDHDTIQDYADKNGICVIEYTCR